MRFALAHKSTTYGVVLSAFFAVAFSGLLSPVLVLVAFFGIVASWRWEPPRIRFERWSLAWTIGAVLAFCYETISVLAGSDILLSGSEFLVILLLVKLFNREASGDYLHIYLLSFLLLTAGTVLNAEVTYGIFFLSYVVTFTWALIIFHLRRELENNFLLQHGHEDAAELARVQRVMNSRRIVGKKFFWGTSAVSMAVFGGAMSLFLLFPRIGFGLFFDKGRSNITMAGFSDGVQLGGHGLIKSDTTVVMRVEVESIFQGRRAPYLHWRGVAFDLYSKGQWKRSRKAPETRDRVSPMGRSSRYHLLYEQRGLREADLDRRVSTALKQEIYLEPLGYNVLFGASMPLAFDFETKIGGSKTRTGQNDELRKSHSAGIKYTVYSDPEPPDSERLRQAGTTLPASYQVYLQLPEEIPECSPPHALPVGDWLPGDVPAGCRVRALARWITRGATNHYDQAKALETWLRSQLEYTLEMKSPGEMEPVEFFLFNRKKGHCEYFSSAMAVMARSLGIPTRNVNGFLGGEWNEYDNYIAVRAGDAHSWVEVYFPDNGWVTFDPTPSGESDLLGRGGGSLTDRMRRIADTIRFKWFKWVIEYDLYRQLELFRNFGKSIKSGANNYFKNPLRNAGRWAKEHKAGAAAGAVSLALLFGFASYWQRRKRGERLLAPRAAAKKGRSPIARHYLSALRSLAKRGLRRDDATTPREFARALQRMNIPGAESMERLTEIYYRAEYSERAEATSSFSTRDSEQLAAAVKQALRDYKVKRSSPARL